MKNERVNFHLKLLRFFDVFLWKMENKNYEISFVVVTGTDGVSVGAVLSLEELCWLPANMLTAYDLMQDYGLAEDLLQFPSGLIFNSSSVQLLSISKASPTLASAEENKHHEERTPFPAACSPDNSAFHNRVFIPLVSRLTILPQKQF